MTDEQAFTECKSTCGEDFKTCTNPKASQARDYFARISKKKEEPVEETKEVAVKEEGTLEEIFQGNTDIIKSFRELLKRDALRRIDDRAKLNDELQKLSKKAQEMVKTLRVKPFSDNARVAQLLGAILDEDITKFVKEIVDFPSSGTVIIPTGGGHSYTKGEPILILNSDDQRCFTMNGDLGNHMSKTEFRYATPEEIERFFQRLPNKGLMSYIYSYMKVRYDKE